MTQGGGGGSPGRLLHLSGCGGLFFYARRRNPAGKRTVCRILLHIAAKMRILSKNFVIFPYCK